MENSVSGVLKRTNKQNFVLRSFEKSLRASPQDILVSPGLSSKNGLTEGAVVCGQAKRQKGKTHLLTVESVGGLPPEKFKKRKHYAELTAIDPFQRFDLGVDKEISMRTIDLIAPIGKGTRSLIVSPPKAGKTVLLEKIVRAVRSGSPESRIIVLLVDERPEEVTSFRRSTEGADILASTSDHSADEHAELAEMVLQHVQVELECGRDLVLVIDSLTRMGRAFNNRLRNRSRQKPTMSGGLEAGVLEIPRRLFGLARKVENGGSVTIVATCLVDTGSRMDQLIFEEFKGTGNSEIILDRTLAEARIFPAINIPASGTRKEAKLYSEKENYGLKTLRKVLSSYNTRDATLSLLKLMERYPSNAAFLDSMAAGSPSR
jgi:transcription termination factor Rho